VLVIRGRKQRRLGGDGEQDLEVAMEPRRPRPLEVEQGGDVGAIPEHVLEMWIAVDEPAVAVIEGGPVFGDVFGACVEDRERIGRRTGARIRALGAELYDQREQVGER
jgi:hypothetical protein